VYEIVWEYEVMTEHVAAFEALYGADGDWARLFRRADGYVETRLYRDTAWPMLYLTIDRWLSRAAYEAFVQIAGPAYAALDRRGDALTARERRVGAFEG
jgi:heme-degrading monooxygenase HmoA